MTQGECSACCCAAPADAGVPATDLAGEMLSRAMEEMDASAGVDDRG
jgi:hypothetical protein